MSYHARIRRLERIFRRPAVNPENIRGVLDFFKSGNEDEIPEGVSFEDVRAAVRRIPEGEAAGLPGLDKLRAALGVSCGRGEILADIMTRKPESFPKFILPKIIWPDLGEGKEGEGRRGQASPADILLDRLGYQRIVYIVYPEPGEAGALWRR
jgi:hypothetical protein